MTSAARRGTTTDTTAPFGRWSSASSRSASLVWLVVVIDAAIGLGARHFPYQDGPNHLARYVLLDQAWFRVVPADVHARLLPTSYIAVDLLGAGLVHVFGPAPALRAMTVLAMTLTPLGSWLLLRRTAARRSDWAIVAALFSLSWFLLDGLLNFVIGVGLAMMWLAAWWPYRDTASAPRRILLAVAAAALYFVHLSAPIGVLVVVWVDWGLALLTWARAPRAPHPGVWRRASMALVTAAAVAVLWIVAEASLGEAAVGGPLEFRPPLMKLAALGAPFYAFSIAQAIVFAAAWGVSLAAFLRANRGDVRLDTMTVSALVFLGLFLISPRSIGSAGGVDVRWLAFAYLLPFCATARGATRVQTPALNIAFVAVMCHALVIWKEVVIRDGSLDDYDTVLAQLPHGSRLLPVVADNGRSARVGTYDEYAFWHIVRNAGRVPGLFNLTPPRHGEALFRHFAHFDLGPPPWMPPFGWGTASFEPLPWDRISRDYDFIVQAGDDPRVTTYLRAHARESGRAGEIRLYRVAPP